MGHFRVLVACAVYLCADLSLDSQLLAEFATKGFGRCFTWFLFSSREFPQEGERASPAPLAYQDFSIGLDQGRHYG
jgi:hypothetical protein